MDYFQYRRSPPHAVEAPDSQHPRRPRSVVRLVNLALGISAAAALLRYIFPLPSLTTVLLEPWFSRSSLQTVPPWTLVAYKIGLDLWLPASVLMILFALMGLPRKLEAPSPRFSGTILEAAWVSYVILAIALKWLAMEFEGSDAAGAVGLIVAIPLIPLVSILSLAGFRAALAQLAVLWRHRSPEHSTRASCLWLAWAFIPPILLVLPLWFAPSQPRALTVRADQEFAALCRTTGVRFLAKPSGPVRSIAYDWNPQRMERPPGIISVDERGRFAGTGGSWGGPREVGKGPDRLVFDFIESRQDDWCNARSDLRMPYAHCPSIRANLQLKAPYYAIDTFTADVLAYFEVDRLDFKINRITHGPVRFQITLTDRRSGAVLGEMAYVVDRADQRACGVNFGNQISYPAFIWDAIHQ